MRKEPIIIGNKYQRFTVIGLDHIDINHMKYWKVKCDCGKDMIKRTEHLKNSISCGCHILDNKKEEFIGKTFNYLTVISFDKVYRAAVYWLCKCICGNTVSVKSTYLKTDHTKSCGCQRSNRLEPGESSFNSLIRSYKTGAKQRGKDFELTKEQIRIITKSNCYYCGIEPKQISKHPDDLGEYYYNGIDRVDSEKGYINGNCVPCCQFCNRAKSNFPIEEFYSKIIRIYIKYMERKNGH